MLRVTALSLLLSSGVLSAAPATSAVPLPVMPVSRLKEPKWKERFEAKKAEVAKGGYDMVFIGDSITQRWERDGKEVWEKFYASRHVLNLGYSGDHTEHVLWRLTHGEIQDITPKLFVVMIGTNNTGHRKDAPAQTAEGVKRIIELLQINSPASKILLLSILPREQKPGGALRPINDQINALIRGYADGDKVQWLDLGPLFLGSDGTISPEIMPDFLHPGAKGYQMWAEAMEPKIKELLGE